MRADDKRTLTILLKMIGGFLHLSISSPLNSRGSLKSMRKGLVVFPSLNHTLIKDFMLRMGPIARDVKSCRSHHNPKERAYKRMDKHFHGRESLLIIFQPKSQLWHSSQRDRFLIAFLSANRQEVTQN